MAFRRPAVSEPKVVLLPALSSMAVSSPDELCLCVLTFPSGSVIVVSVALMYLKTVWLPRESSSLDERRSAIHRAQQHALVPYKAHHLKEQ